MAWLCLLHSLSDISDRSSLFCSFDYFPSISFHLAVFSDAHLFFFFVPWNSFSLLFLGSGIKRIDVKGASLVCRPNSGKPDREGSILFSRVHATLLVTVRPSFRHAVEIFAEKLYNQHPCPPIRDWCCCVYGLVTIKCRTQRVWRNLTANTC